MDGYAAHDRVASHPGIGFVVAGSKGRRGTFTQSREMGKGSKEQRSGEQLDLVVIASDSSRRVPSAANDFAQF